MAATKKKILSVGNVAALLVATSLIGQILGFLRTKLVNANFQPSGPHSTDAYFAAFTIPDFFFFTLAAGSLGVAFMPILAEHYHKGDKQAMWQLSASLLNLLAMAMAVVGVVMFVFARPLIEYVAAPGLKNNPQDLDIAVNIMRFLAFNPLLFTVSGLLTSIQQTMGRFFFFAIAPLFYNLSIILSIFMFKSNIGLVGLGIGALAGAVLQLLVIVIGMAKTGYRWKPTIIWKKSDFQQVLRALPARSLDLGVDQVEDVVETHIASSLSSGSISFFNSAYVLSTAPILLVGTTISTAAFPKMNARLAQGRPDLFRKEFLQILRAMIWIATPLVVFCYFGRGYLARMIYSQGNAAIASIFGALTVAIFFRIIYSIISRWFYSQKDTKTPLIVSLVAVALDIVLAYWLARPNHFGAGGLAVAQSIVAFVEVLILSIVMLIRDRKLLNWPFWDGILRTLSVTGFSVAAGYTMVGFYPLSAHDKGIFVLGSKLAFIGIVIFLVHLLVSTLFGIEETKPIWARLRKIAMKPLKVDL